MNHPVGLVFLSILMSVLMISGCGKSSIDTKTEYQAVFLDNGQVFFGKAEVGPEFVTVRDVFYIQNTMTQETKEVRNILVKRGQEWHGPDSMYINKTHVVLIEPVSHDSQVAKLIRESDKQKTDKK